MKLKTLQNVENRRLLPVTLKVVVALMLILMAAGGAMAAGEPDEPADQDAPEDETSVIPAVSFGKILEETYKLISEWFRTIVVVMIIAGGIYYMFGRSDDAKASGLSHLKRPVEAVVAVMGLLWLINLLYTLA